MISNLLSTRGKAVLFVALCFLISITLLFSTVLPMLQGKSGKLPITGETTLSSEQVIKIEDFVEKQMKKDDIPGMALAIVKGDKTIYNKGFGYKDIKTKEPVNRNSVFEIASNSKAYTALGLLMLKDKGLLNLDDPVRKYIPWLKVKYNGKYVDMTIRQVLHQTSGVPSLTLGYMPVGDGDDSYDKTVRMLVDTELNNMPGEKYEYASLNYDILGLIIQNISGKTFEQYIKENLLQPLGLDNTYLSRKEALENGLVKGYKISFFTNHEYIPPVFRGNTPAGYFYTNSIDIAKWMKVQLGTIETPYKKIIEETQIPDRSISPIDIEDFYGSSYAMGWFVYQKGSGEISHSGGNPNFSSYIVLRPKDGLGVAMLANKHTEITYETCQGVMDMLLGKDVTLSLADNWTEADRVASSAVIILAPFIVAIIILLILFFIDTIKKKRKFTGISLKGIVSFIISVAFMVLYIYCIMWIPDVLMSGLPVQFISVWLPGSILAAMVGLISAGVLLYLYLLLSNLFVKEDEKQWFPVITLGLVSGLGNAIIIFAVNLTLSPKYYIAPLKTAFGKIGNPLFWYFFIGLLVYVYGQKIIRTKLIRIANNIVYEKRTFLIDKILATPFDKFEKIDHGRIQACLNNDTEVISGSVNIIISAITSMVTMICCFIYLGVYNFYGFIISLVVILLSAGLYFLTGVKARKLMEASRSIQNIFFKNINDLVLGFKELSISRNKKNGFRTDIEVNCQTYREKRALGELMFANVFVVGEILFVLVIGAAAFIFPIIFPDMTKDSMKTYVFIFLYLAGPVRVILAAIPNGIGIKICWDRINEMIHEISDINAAKNLETNEIKALNEKKANIVEIDLRSVEYQYRNEDDSNFKLGPIDLNAKSGEVVFITGGNGSGKSTLAKLITGLYVPDNGKIQVNGKDIGNNELSQFFSAIFSDYYLFDKLYGIDCENMKRDVIDGYLDLLHIGDKVKITEGEFSTLKLSAGQRKRLALFISYLEDKPIFLFDEWAADQDPEFRNYFYLHLLPELKKKGKCVIAITHDDRYFELADKLIKLEMGKIINK